jgi:hypothetical protein
MPWRIEQRGGKHCVIKEGESSPVPGGCHESRADAVKHQRALYASEEGATVDEMSKTDDLAWSGIYSGTSNVPAGSFLIVPYTSDTGNMSTVTVTVGDAKDDEESVREGWEGVLGIEGALTADRRYLMPGQIADRDLPMPIMVQTVNDEGHKGSELGGRIDAIERIPVSEFTVDGFDLSGYPEGAVVIWARGSFDGSQAGEDAVRVIENGGGISVDLSVSEVALLDPETFEPVDQEELDLASLLLGDSDLVTGISGTIMGATVVPFPAFEDASIRVITASGGLHLETSLVRLTRTVLTAAAAGMAPLHPPASWFSNPGLTGPTALEVAADGRVFGHLALWGTCHIGFPGVCTTAPRSFSNYELFHLGAVVTDEDLAVACGQITFDTGHAPTSYGPEKTIAHYDDTGCAVADVVCGEDAFGIWVAGAVRPGVKAETVRKLRGSKLSGDWRSVNGNLELVGILAVNVPGFPVPRTQAAIAASAGEGEVLALVAAGIVGDTTYRARRRKKSMLTARLRAALGTKLSPREQMRKDALERAKPAA